MRSKTVMGRSGALRRASIAAASPAATPPTMTSPSLPKCAAVEVLPDGKALCSLIETNVEGKRARRR